MRGFTFESHVDSIDLDQMSGWAKYREVNVVVEIHVVIDGKVEFRVLADEHRDDLRTMRADGNFAFSCKFPERVRDLLSRADRVEVVEGRIGGRPLEGNEFVRAPVQIVEAAPAQIQTPSAESFNPFKSSDTPAGLWIDRPDWIDVLGKKLRTGELTETVCERIYRFVRDGFVVIPGAVDRETIAEVNADIERFWEEAPRGLFIETFEPDSEIKVMPPVKEYRPGRTKMLDLYAHSAAARRAIANQSALEFLSAVFEERPKAFQSLNFWFGSGQPMHKDSAYVKIDDNPTAFAATWLALEDLSVGSGELEYYAGSHHAPPFLFGGEDKWMEAYPQDHDRFLESLHDDARKYHHSKHSFVARAGDLLIWHADLAHGGSPVVNRVTRKSLVTHFTPASASPFYYRKGRKEEVVVNSFTFSSQYSNVR